MRLSEPFLAEIGKRAINPPKPNNLAGVGVARMNKRLSLHDIPKKHWPKDLKKAVKVPSSESKAETLFLFHVQQYRLPLPVREFVFSEQTTRKWRFDFAWPLFRIAVEIEGLTHVKTHENGKKQVGRHQSLAGYTEDCEKYNQATAEGWRVFHFTPKHVKTLHAITFISDYLKPWLNEGDQ